MAGLMVTRAVTVRAIVTDQLKKELIEELQGMADETQRRIDQMDFEARRYLAELQRTNLTQAMAVRKQIEAEKSKQEGAKKDILERISDVEKLELGSEFPRMTLEGAVEIAQGDNLYDKLARAEILIKDGVVVEIRNA
jgi:hypothetical protein